MSIISVFLCETRANAQYGSPKVRTHLGSEEHFLDFSILLPVSTATTVPSPRQDCSIRYGHTGNSIYTAPEILAAVYILALAPRSLGRDDRKEARKRQMSYTLQSVTDMRWTVQTSSQTDSRFTCLPVLAQVQFEHGQHRQYFTFKAMTARLTQPIFNKHRT